MTFMHCFGLCEGFGVGASRLVLRVFAVFGLFGLIKGVLEIIA